MGRRSMEATPLLSSDIASSSNQRSTYTSPHIGQSADKLNDQYDVDKPEALPKWFVALAATSVTITVLWLLLLIILQHLPTFHSSDYLSSKAAMNLYLYAGVFNSMLGSFLSASGYCCQKWAHLRVATYPELGAASQQWVFISGLLLLAIGTISAVINLGILGQAVQAPFAALTLIYSALLGHFVLKEPFLLYDALSSTLIVLGVGIDVFAAQMSTPPPRSYTLETLGQIFFRSSPFPIGYTFLSLSYICLILRQVHQHKLYQRAIGLLAFSSCAGVMAGYTSLATKSAVEVIKSSLRYHEWGFISPFFIIIVLMIPGALVPQLFFLNKGLEHFGTLKFIPLYQAFIILGNTVCGMIFYNELQTYTTLSLVCFLLGVVVTLCGVMFLLAKADSEAKIMREDQNSQEEIIHRFETDFTFDSMRFAEHNVKPLEDFDACKREIIRLLQTAKKSIYYSTFLCDFTQILSTPKEEPCTFLSLLHEAVERGVHVSILYNPLVDYGTASVAELSQSLPRNVHLVCSESDLGPSFFTRCLSNNSRYAFHHQKYLCIDEEEILVTGCDVNSEREGWLQRNGLNYYWHELGVVVPCTSEMAAWIRGNHTSKPVQKHFEEHIESPPFPFVSGGWREENAMVNMILNAKHSIHLENQILISGGHLQHNRICAAIVSRICRAHRHKQSFAAILLTNAAQQDEPSLVTRMYCEISTQWSLDEMISRANEEGLDVETLAKYLVVGRMEYDNVLIKVHSNILIVDGEYALRSSSNLADRSLSARPTDTELGVMFQGETVKNFQRKLFQRYFATEDKLDVSDVLCKVQANQGGCLIPLTKKKWNAVMTWFLMNVFIFGSEGATGGRYKVTYKTKVVKTGEDFTTYVRVS